MTDMFESLLMSSSPDSESAYRLDSENVRDLQYFSNLQATASAADPSTFDEEMIRCNMRLICLALTSILFNVYNSSYVKRTPASR